ncbi:hypothetical protein [Flavobacterium sp.]|uniref:hypothetical protein n=1 Tax=Flavobacterium sp. TaxID=239 RepID=UPI002602AAFA|nr:hypothetical protein [Flavobacterium sp.]
MKTSIAFLFILAGFGFLASCSSDNGSAAPQNLVGNWIWMQSVGGTDGGTETPSSTGTVRSLAISTTAVKTYTNGALTGTFPYTIETHTSIFGGQKPMLVFAEARKQSFELTSTQLRLNDECYDCYSSQYEKALEE